VETQARSLADRLREAFAAGSGLVIGLIVGSFTDRIRDWFEDKLTQVAITAREDHLDNLLRGANTSQLRSIFDLPIGSKGEILPQPEVPSDLVDESLSKREILEHISSLVTVPGDSAETKRTPPKEILRDRLNRILPIRSIVRSVRPNVSAAYEAKLAFHAERLKQRLASAQARLQVIDDPREWAKRFESDVMVPLGVKSSKSGPVGYAADIARELRHEAARVKEQVKDADAEAIAAGVEVGYTLFSRFLESTRPQHAANDGLRFYRDNRSGAADTWEKRIIPPYAKNCVCFTVPILDTPEGDEFSASFDVRLSRGENITLRDVGTFGRWFDRQRPGIQQKLIGQEEWAAVNEKGRRPTYADFFQPNGTPMKASELDRESAQDLERRRVRTQIIFDTQERRHRGSWEEPGWLNRFSSEPKLEAEYRRRLRNYLRRLGV